MASPTVYVAQHSRVHSSLTTRCLANFEIDLNIMPYLRILTLFAHFSGYHWEINDQFHALANALENLAAERTLEEIHLVLYIDGYMELTGGAVVIPPLDTVLASDSFFRLRWVNILIHPVEEISGARIVPDIWTAPFWSMFPSLRTQRKLSVNWYIFATDHGDPTADTAWQISSHFDTVQRISSHFFALPPRVD